MKKIEWRKICYWSLISIPVLILLNLLLKIKMFSGLVELFYSRIIYRFVSSVLSTLTSLLPFSIIEIIILISPFFITCILVFLIKNSITQLIKLKKGIKESSKTFFNILAVICALTSVGFALYTSGLSLNYNRRPISRTLALDTSEPSKEELAAAFEYIIKNANQSCVELDWTSYDEILYNGNIGGQTNATLKKMGQTDPLYKGGRVIPKPLLTSNYLSRTSITAFFSPYTYETNYIASYPLFSIPQTLCHESAHLRGFAREDESEYIGFIACTQSNDKLFRFSGYMYAYNLFGNALYKTDKKSYEVLSETADRRIHSQWKSYSEFTEQHKDSSLNKTTEKVNDIYIKSQGVSDGVQSYDRSLLLIIGQFRRDGVI